MLNRKTIVIAASALCVGAFEAHAQGVPTVDLSGKPSGADAQSVMLNCLSATASGTYAVPCGGDPLHPMFVSGASGSGSGGGAVTQGAGSSASPWSVQGTLAASELGSWHMSIDTGTLSALPPITGTVSVSGGSIAVSGGTLSASIANFPATQAVQDNAAISSLGSIATNTGVQSGNRTFTSCVVGTVSTQCLPALPGRRGLVVENHSGETGAPSSAASGVTCAESVTATAFLGWVLQGNGGAFELELPNVIPNGAINCISNGAAPVTITLGQV